MNLPNISENAIEFLKTKSKVWPCHTNRASSLDDPCERRLVYMRTMWQKAKPVPPSLQGIFETGNELEPIIEKILATLGRSSSPQWRIVGSQSDIDANMQRTHDITGHIDGILQVMSEDGTWLNACVVDIKTCSSHVFNTIHTYDDLTKYPWTKKYRGQLFLYALGMDIDKCCIIFVNKQNLYDIKSIFFDLDYDYAEGLLQKAERVNAHVKAGTLPSKINSPEDCSRCKFAHECLPDLIATGNLELFDNTEIEELLKQRDDLQLSKKKFDAIERQLKKKLIEGQDILCGEFIVQWKKVSRSAYEVNASEYWKKEVISVNPDNAKDAEIA